VNGKAEAVGKKYRFNLKVIADGTNGRPRNFGEEIPAVALEAAG